MKKKLKKDGEVYILCAIICDNCIIKFVRKRSFSDAEVFDDEVFDAKVKV